MDSRDSLVSVLEFWGSITGGGFEEVRWVDWWWNLRWGKVGGGCDGFNTLCGNQ